ILPPRHPRRRNSVGDNPLKLSVSVVLNLFSREIGHRRLHLRRKWYAGILAVEPVTDLAMMPKVFRAFLDDLRCIRLRIFIILAADGDLLFDLSHHLLFGTAGRARFAAGHHDSHNSKGYDTCFYLHYTSPGCNQSILSDATIEESQRLALNKLIQD